jgi:DNA-binding NtrC family response regulator
MMMPLTSVLIVDDYEGVRVSVAEILQLHGYQVLSASSIAEAEAIRQRFGLNQLDLVITNLRLSRRTQAREGAELIKHWHAVAPHLPLLLISGDPYLDDLPGLPAGVWCLAKPFTIEALLTTVSRLLGVQSRVSLASQ